MFWIGFSVGLIATIVGIVIGVVITRFSAGGDLNSQKLNSIIGDGPVRSKSPSGKRKPKALTDLMAYQREIEEQGENRG